MLSALAKYIFGGIIENAPEEAIPCETREVNDWLLINMPDQPIDDIDFESDDEKGPESEDDIEMVPENEGDDDDILTSLPLLLAQEHSICDTFCLKNIPVLDKNVFLDTRIATQSALLNECIENFQILPECLYVNHSLYYPSDYSLVVALKHYHEQALKPKQVIQTENQVMQDEMKRIALQDRNHMTLKLQIDILKEDLLFEAKLRNYLQTISDDAHTHLLNIVKDKVVANPKINAHQKASLIPKEELLREIKHVKPSQKAMQRDMNKYISRSQLNRQNKNYIFENSVKNNRRSNLQRHHSGANNNRKCC